MSDEKGRTVVVQLENDDIDGRTASSSWFGRWFSRTDPVRKAEQEYSQALVSCSSEDFSDLDAMGFLHVGPNLRDKLGRPLIVVVAKNYRPNVVSLDRLYRYTISRCDAVADSSYSMVWMHTGATYWSNCPSLSWMWRTYERLPARYRSNLQSLYVLHCDLSLWLSSMMLCPWWSALLWRKITWISRVEFLWDYVVKKGFPVPAFVAEHDSILEDQPLQDYGLVTSKEMAAAGMPNPM
mmetsp:Transcript_7271/g.15870  ORF Transcript_7271/g.15870 Transcript_7271/m.15870 type:complete len:238 (+) Transcript_7271:119-832(+)